MQKNLRFIFFLLPQLGLLLLAPSCRHRVIADTCDDNCHLRHQHEEATPVSELPHPELTEVTPQRGGH